MNISIAVDEGAPVIVEDVRFEGFEPLPPDGRAALESLPLKAGARRDRDVVRTTRDLGGAFVPGPRLSAGRRRRGRASRRERDVRHRHLSCRVGSADGVRPGQGPGSREAARKKHRARAGVQARRAVRRTQGLAIAAEAEHTRAARSRGGHAPARRAGRRPGAHDRHGDRGQAAPPSLRRWLRFRGKGARHDQLAASEFLRRRQAGDGRRKMVVDRARHRGRADRSARLAQRFVVEDRGNRVASRPAHV